MPLREITITGYRSIRDLTLRMQRTNVIVGPNGCGKTNLYRSLLLISAAVSGQLARTLVDEGGMPSVLWAGRRGPGPVLLTLEVGLEEACYRLSLGLPMPGEPFRLDPRVKEERVWARGQSEKDPLLRRGKSTIWARDAEGRRITYPFALDETESVLSQLREPHRFPYLSALRQEIRGWRFYHGFRTDAESPLRRDRVPTWTPILSQEGSDLASALESIRVAGDGDGLDAAIDSAFPGAELKTDDGCLVRLRMPGFERAFAAAELSDGTLRYLCLLAALLSPRPPTLLALNEPETSIHPDLYEPLARLIVDASRNSQVWVTTHSTVLASHIEALCGAAPVRLEKAGGATRVEGRGVLAGD